MRKLLIIISLALTLTFSGIGLTQSASAVDCKRTDLTAAQQLSCGSCGAAGQTTCEDPAAAAKTSSDSLSKTIANVLNILSLMVGVLAVVMIIVGGFRYVTSGGKQESVSAAKSTILYAAVGLAIVALSQIIVHFVLRNVN